jgi:D-aminopeptidase
VGHVTLARTGVTAIVPHAGSVYRDRPRAGHFVFNGYGKSVGLVQLGELGLLETPILLTNTLSVWTAANALVSYSLERNPEIGLGGGTVNPVVGECSDAYLNDIRSRRVTEADCLRALAGARGGPVAEGNVGAGTGMSCLGFKGGLGASSRVITFETRGVKGNAAAAVGGIAPPGALVAATSFTMGCLVVANFGRLSEFRLDGVPVGRALEEAGWPGSKGEPATSEESATAGRPATAEDEERPRGTPAPSAGDPEAAVPGGSIMIVLATDAPLTSRQLTRVSRRATFGLARTGSVGAHGSGDFVLAFSTADLEPAYPEAPILLHRALAEDDRHFGPLFQAAAEVTEEAIINALFAATTMIGRDGNVRQALPVEEVVSILRRHGRL